jgi:hypothetical protein
MLARKNLSLQLASSSPIFRVLVQYMSGTDYFIREEDREKGYEQVGRELEGRANHIKQPNCSRR